ncbi:MAG: pacearchaeosortase, partial [Nanoarchaeota archaeon]|nr:pacearchaeosortase [Nanoarchaeota archaeon]MBU4116949.1 pacearchaeosortase [Nanoarchaeota archaeon]
MKKSQKELFDIAARYIILILISFSGLWIFYFIFSPITIYLTAFLLKIFFQTSVIGDVIVLKNHFLIQMINACVAGSAYYLLFILNLSIPKINLKKRIKMICFAFGSFLVVNILR